MQHRQYEHRAAIDFGATPDDIATRFATLLTRAPSDRIEVTRRHAVTYREEPPWYFVLTYGALQGMAILTHLTSARTNHPFAATTLAVILDLGALYCLLRLLFASAWRLDIEVSAVELTLRDRFWSRAMRTRSFPVDELGGALVIGEASRRRVVLVGPRNEERAVVFQERFLDPPALARWLADLLATLATGAVAGWTSETK